MYIQKEWYVLIFVVSVRTNKRPSLIPRAFALIRADVLSRAILVISVSPPTVREHVAYQQRADATPVMRRGIERMMV